MIQAEIRHFHLFSGLGGAARGIERARPPRVAGLEGRFRCLGGVDVCPTRAANFTRRVGARGTVLDLFSRQGYELYHGHPPPDGWREATPDDLRRAAGGERPHWLVTSPPCKGFSGLIPEARAGAGRYRALNELALRGIFLALTAWEDDPPEFWLLENVPRIQSRGAATLDRIVAMLEAHGYSVARSTHCLGELGGLAQRRERFELVGRHREKVPPLLYQPERRPLRAVGEVLSALPVPGTPYAAAAGPMHSLPRLQWKTWLRLALVEAGGDWRSLRRLAVRDGIVEGIALVPHGWHHGALGVASWDDPGPTVTSGARPTTGRFSVADPRVREAWKSTYGVLPWEACCGAVTGEANTTTGRFSVADPRPTGYGEYQQLGVIPWNGQVGAVTGQAGPGQGRYAIADPRQADRVAFNNVYRLIRFDQPANAVTAGGTPCSGGQSVADPRLGCEPGFARGAYGIVPWTAPARAVLGSACHDNSTSSVADPRLPDRESRHRNQYRVTPWDAPSGTVIAATRPGSGAAVVADPRPLDPQPEPSDQVETLIVALDGTWHRPLTTLELAALQGLLDPGEVLELEGTGHTQWRAMIGDAIPPPAAAAWAEVIGSALLAAWSGTYLQACHTEPWCRPLVAAVSVDQPEVAP